MTLTEMAEVTQRENLLRTTLYLVSPALSGVGKMSNCSDGEDSNPTTARVGRWDKAQAARSRLYHPEHSHLFRPPP